MPNITSFNINDIALYYQAIECLARDPIKTGDAAEQIRGQLVAYLERRRAARSLPPLRGQMTSLGEKTLLDLRQMRLVEADDSYLRLTPSGSKIAKLLAAGEGRLARRLLLSALIDTYDNVRRFLTFLTPPAGQSISLPVPRTPSGAEEIMDDDEENGETDDGLELEAVCKAWRDWCQSHDRPDLVPHSFEERAGELFEQSRDKSVANRIKNVVEQLVVDQATAGVVSRISIYRTLRDRLSTAGAVNSWLRSVPGAPLAVETVYSCLHIGTPAAPAEWVRLDVTSLPQDVYVHEPDSKDLADKLLPALRDSAALLTPRAGYFRIYELRDRVCDSLKISQGVFNAAFVHLYRSRPGVLSLGVDYETITAKRLPIEIREHGRSDFFNLVAFRNEI